LGFGANLLILKNVVTKGPKPENYRNRNPHISKIGKQNYFRFVSQTVGVEATTFLSRMQKLVKIGKELCA